MIPLLPKPSLFEKLLVRPLPLDGEDERGFWLRLAHENGLKRPQWLMNPGGRWPTSLTRFCPECLSGDSPRWRHDWSGSGAYWCDRHLSWLVDECAACRRRLRWSGIRFLECACGAQLGDQVADLIDVPIKSAVSEALAPVEVLRLLGAFSLHGPAGKLGKKAGRTSIQSVRDQLEAGMRMVKDWPNTFRIALDRYRAPPDSDGTVQLLREAFPGLVELPRMVADKAWREKITGAIDAYCLDSVGGDHPIVGRNAVLTTGPLTLREMAAQLGRRTESIARVLDGEDAPAVGVRVTLKGRRRRVIKCNDLEQIGALLEEHVHLKVAARMLLLSVARIRALIGGGLLTETGGRLLRSQLNSLALSLREQRRDFLDLAGPVVPLRTALRTWISVEETAPLIEALRSGELRVAAFDPQAAVGQLQVSKSAVQAWSAARRKTADPFVSLSHAASELGLKQDVLRDLVRLRLLPAVIGVSAHRRSWLVSSSELAVFKVRYVPLAALTRAASVRPRDCLSWAVERRLTLACGPRIDGSRQYLVDRGACAGGNDG